VKVPVLTGPGQVRGRIGSARWRLPVPSCSSVMLESHRATGIDEPAHARSHSNSSQLSGPEGGSECSGLLPLHPAPRSGPPPHAAPVEGMSGQVHAEFGRILVTANDYIGIIPDYFGCNRQAWKTKPEFKAGMDKIS